MSLLFALGPHRRESKWDCASRLHPCSACKRSAGLRDDRPLRIAVGVSAAAEYMAHAVRCCKPPQCIVEGLLVCRRSALRSLVLERQPHSLILRQHHGEVFSLLVARNHDAEFGPGVIHDYSFIHANSRNCCGSVTASWGKAVLANCHTAYARFVLGRHPKARVRERSAISCAGSRG